MFVCVCVVKLLSSYLSNLRGSVEIESRNKDFFLRDVESAGCELQDMNLRFA